MVVPREATEEGQAEEALARGEVVAVPPTGVRGPGLTGDPELVALDLFGSVEDQPELQRERKVRPFDADRLPSAATVRTRLAGPLLSEAMLTGRDKRLGGLGEFNDFLFQLTGATRVPDLPDVPVPEIVPRSQEEQLRLFREGKLHELFTGQPLSQALVPGAQVTPGFDPGAPAITEQPERILTRGARLGGERIMMPELPGILAAPPRLVGAATGVLEKPIEAAVKEVFFTDRDDAKTQERERVREMLGDIITAEQLQDVEQELFDKLVTPEEFEARMAMEPAVAGLDDPHQLIAFRRMNDLELVDLLEPILVGMEDGEKKTALGALIQIMKLSPDQENEAREVRRQALSPLVLAVDQNREMIRAEIAMAQDKDFLGIIGGEARKIWEGGTALVGNITGFSDSMIEPPIDDRSLGDAFWRNARSAAQLTGAMVPAFAASAIEFVKNPDKFTGAKPLETFMTLWPLTSTVIDTTLGMGDSLIGANSAVLNKVGNQVQMSIPQVQRLIEMGKSFRERLRHVTGVSTVRQKVDQIIDLASSRVGQLKAMSEQIAAIQKARHAPKPPTPRELLAEVGIGARELAEEQPVRVPLTTPALSEPFEVVGGAVAPATTTRVAQAGPPAGQTLPPLPAGRQLAGARQVRRQPQVPDPEPVPPQGIGVEVQRPVGPSVERLQHVRQGGRFAVELVEDAKKVLGELKEAIPGSEGQAIAREIQNVLTTTGPGMLASRKFRRAVLKNMNQRAKEMGIERADRVAMLRHARKTFEGFAAKRPGERVLPRFQVGDKTISSLESMFNAMDELPGKVREEVMSEALRNLVAETSRRVERASFRDGITGHSRLADNLTLRDAKAGWQPPSILRIDPQQALRVAEEALPGRPLGANSLSEVVVRLNKELKGRKARGELSPLQEIRARAYIKRVSKYKELDEGTATALGLPEGQKFYMPAPAERVFRWRVAAQRATSSDGLLQSFNRGFRSKIIAENLSSAINNYSANFMMQFTRRGGIRANVLGPENFFVKQVQLARLWDDFMKGKAIDPRMADDFKALRETGLLDTDLIRAELGGMQAAGMFDGVPGLGRFLDEVSEASGVAKLRRKMRQFYQMGDNLFKLEEAIFAMNRIRQYLETLQDGKWAKVEIAKGRFAKIEKLGDNRFAINGKAVSQAQLSRVLAKAGAKAANDLFFDYSKVPLLLDALRTIPALGILSPTLTWMWKAIDVPLVKKGLVGKAIDNAGPRVLSNDFRVNALRTLEATELGAYRTMQINAVRDEIMSHDPEIIRRVTSFMPREQRATLVEMMTNPAYVQIKDLGNIDNFEPTMGLVRGLQWGGTAIEGLIRGETGSDQLAKLYKELPDDPSKLDFDMEGYPPEQKKRILQIRKLMVDRMSGQQWEAADFATYAGLAGSVLYDTLRAIDEAEKPGSTLNMRKIVRGMGTVLVGGTLGKAGLEVVEGVANSWGDADSSISKSVRDRFNRKVPTNLKQGLVRQFVRGVLGVGWDVRSLDQMGKSYLTRMKIELKAQLTRPYQDSIDQAEADKTAEGITRDQLSKLEADIEVMKQARDKFSDIIEHEVGAAQDRWNEVKDLITIKARRTKVPRTLRRQLIDLESRREEQP